MVDGGSGLSVLALRNLWDRGHGRPIQPRQEAQRQQVEELPVPPPALPPNRKDRKLMGAVSMDTVVLTQVRRADHLLNHCWIVPHVQA